MSESLSSAEPAELARLRPPVRSSRMRMLALATATLSLAGAAQHAVARPNSSIIGEAGQLTRGFVDYTSGNGEPKTREIGEYQWDTAEVAADAVRRAHNNGLLEQGYYEGPIEAQTKPTDIGGWLEAGNTTLRAEEAIIFETENGYVVKGKFTANNQPWDLEEGSGTKVEQVAACFGIKVAGALERTSLSEPEVYELRIEGSIDINELVPIVPN